MCIPRIRNWLDSLRQSLHRVYEPTTRTPIPWLLNGEASLALQGVDINPETIEFRATSPFAVAYFSGFMKPYEAPANAATIIHKRGAGIAPSDSWRSNVHQRIVAWSSSGWACWLGRWNVEGLPVQVVYTRGIESEPLSGVMPEDVRRVHFEGMEVAVVPLEFLLADSAARGESQTTNRIVHALRSSGYELSTLNRALDTLPAQKASHLLRLLEIRLVG